MVFEGCPMLGSGAGYGGYAGYAGFFINVIIAAIIFALIFWGAYYLIIKNKAK